MKIPAVLLFFYFAINILSLGTDAFTPYGNNNLDNSKQSAAAAAAAYYPSSSPPPPSFATSTPSESLLTSSPEVIVQGGSLRTWAFGSHAVERVQVVLKTDGRPLDADVELWAGPDNTPHKMRLYVENGALCPFSAIMETPRGPNTIAIRNIGQLEFPIIGCINAVQYANDKPNDTNNSIVVQGGALRTFPFDGKVESVKVTITTDGRPLNARIELLQGPNNNKQVLEVYTEDGYDRPLSTLIETPGSGNVVRIVNTATVEFPMYASVTAHRIKSYQQTVEQNEMKPIISGNNGYAGPIHHNNFKSVRDGTYPQW